MNSPDFVHLHLHSEYSLLDGAIQFEKLGPYLLQNGMNTVAVTDHGNLYGAVHFCDKMKEAGVKPIVGCEVYIVPGSRFDKKAGRGSLNYYHLTLLASTAEGYSNLMKLSSGGTLLQTKNRQGSTGEVLIGTCDRVRMPAGRGGKTSSLREEG